MPTTMPWATSRSRLVVGRTEAWALLMVHTQGFSKEIREDKSIWAAYIKDYEGGTLMEVSLLHTARCLLC